MKQNVTREQIVNQLVNVFRSEEIETYNSANECRQGICGWCGVMAPLSRPAYIADFGLETVVAAEIEARAIINADRMKYEASEFHAHEIEADNHKAMGQPVPQEGSFMWAVYSGFKCDGGNGIYDELKGKLYEDSREISLLVNVEKVYHVTEEEFKAPETANKISQLEDCPGGWHQEEGDYLDVKKMHYTFAGAVVAPDGRYFLVDDEGYSYARYVLTPIAWREMFSEEVAQIREENRKEAEEMARQAEEARQQRLADYKARCAKWESLMTDIAPYQEEVERQHKQNGWNSKEYKAAERKLHSIRRANILTMCKAAFPGVKFSLKKNTGWGSDWQVSWEDGPTEATFMTETDLGLFSTYHDTFDGYDDSTGVSYEEFTEFAYKYMGNCNSINTMRNMSEEKKEELIADIIHIVPAFDTKNSYGFYERVVINIAEVESLEKHFKMSRRMLFGFTENTTPEIVARNIWNETDYITKVKVMEKPVEITLKTVGKEGDLELVDYSEKAVAIVGNTREYVAKLKELGGRFNGKLKCGAGWVFSKKREPELRAVFSL